MTKKRGITIGHVGLGKWGLTLFDNFSALAGCRVKYACDLRQELLSKLQGEFDTKFIDDVNEMLADEEVEAVVVATEAPSHYKIALSALKHNKHVYIEKPITLDIAQAEELVELAKKNNKKIMVGHLLLYHPAIKKLKELITAGELGKINYVGTQRLNLGRIRETENVVWSLAPHDISIVLYLIGKQPTGVFVHGADFIQKNIADMAFLNLRFNSGEIAHIQVSWLNPEKQRRTVVVGSKKMAVFDEILNGGTLQLFDKGAALTPNGVELKSGQGGVVALSSQKPLEIECQHFIDCVRDNCEPLSNGGNGLAVLSVLMAAEKSLFKQGCYELL